MLLKELIENKQGVIDWNEHLENLKLEYTDDEYIQKMKPMESYEDEFLPYQKWFDDITEKDRQELKIIDETLSDFSGVYIADCNAHHSFDRLTTHKIIDVMNINKQLYWRDYGVCDNASQAIEYYEKLKTDGIISDTDTFIITMMPVFKKNSGGWRWHKWGPYIGVQNPECEYIGDEDNIDMVYCFHIHQIEV